MALPHVDGRQREDRARGDQVGKPLQMMVVRVRVRVEVEFAVLVQDGVGTGSG